jgi:hypothetical protein
MAQSSNGSFVPFCLIQDVTACPRECAYSRLQTTSLEGGEERGRQSSQSECRKYTSKLVMPAMQSVAYENGV